MCLQYSSYTNVCERLLLVGEKRPEYVATYSSKFYQKADNFRTIYKHMTCFIAHLEKSAALQLVSDYFWVRYFKVLLGQYLTQNTMKYIRSLVLGHRII